MAIDISNATISGLARISGNLAIANSTRIREPANDKTITLQPALLAITLSADVYFGSWSPSSIITAQASISAVYNPGNVFSGGISAEANISARFYAKYVRQGLVGWSKIGDTRILVDESNESGFAYLPGRDTGLVYRILALDEKYPIAYSSSGIFMMVPVSQPYATFGFKRLSEVGILGPGCVCGDDGQHFFINKEYALCRIVKGKDGVEVLGYAEFMQSLSPAGQTIVMSYDKAHKRCYISSAISGFVLTEMGLGGGFANLTTADGVLFASPITLSSPSQEGCTDILDMGFRGIKTLEEVLIATDVSEDLYVAIDYRYHKDEAFSTSAWKLCNNEGVVRTIVSGLEFRVRWKTLTHADFEVDYISIRHKLSDRRYNRSKYSD